MYRRLTTWIAARRQPELQGWAAMLNPRRLRVIIGPIAVARAYATRKRWEADEVKFVTCPDDLRSLDPAGIERILTMRTRALGKDVHVALLDEVSTMRRLYDHIQLETVAR